MTKVSIIVPNYNHAKYLERRLYSIFYQTYNHFEVILLDDASSDDSLDILKKYAHHDKVSHFIVNQKNSGSPFKQWKKGIELAKGELIWIAETDDWAELNFLETLVPKFEENIGIVYAASNIIDFNNYINFETLNDHSSANGRWASDFCANGVAEIKEHLQFEPKIINASAVLFDKKYLKNIDWLEEYRFGGDWRVWIEILKHSDLKYCVQKLNNWYINAGGTTFSQYQLKDDFQRMKEIFKIIKSTHEAIGSNNTYHPVRHKWVMKWYLNKALFFYKKINYYFPPAPIKFLFFFYPSLLLYILKNAKKIAKKLLYES